MEIEKYKRRVEEEISDETLQPRLSAQRKLEGFIGGGEPTPDDVEEWLDYMMENDNIKNSSIREYFKAVKYYFTVVKGEPEALDHIAEWVPSNNSDAGDYLTEDEWVELYDNIHKTRDKAVYNIMYHYARRPSEILFLNKEDVDLEEGTIRFLILKKNDPNLPTIKIGGEERKLFRATFRLKEEPRKMIEKAMRYMPDQKVTIVEEGEKREVEPLFTTTHGRLSYTTIYSSLKEAAERTSIDKNITPKTMRHSRATHLDIGGKAPGNIARDMLVHSPETDVIGRYVHDRGEDEVREVMEVREE